MRESAAGLTTFEPANASTSGGEVAARCYRGVCFTCGEAYVGVTDVVCPFCGSTDLARLRGATLDELLTPVGAD